MTLEIEKLLAEIDQMARGAFEGQQARRHTLDEALAKLRRHATAWEQIEAAVERARQLAGVKLLRAALPFDHETPLDTALTAPPPPAQATVIASDGSQIPPDRHAAHLYALVNVGIFVYFHGRGRRPAQFSLPALDYPGRDGAPDDEPFADSPAVVALRRDRAEIETLATVVEGYQETDVPLVALLDQRLLYWPAIGAGEGSAASVLSTWQASMSRMGRAGAALAGYIVRPGKRSVLTMLDALDIGRPGFDPERLKWRGGPLTLLDAAVFSHLLGPGQRSKLFRDVSEHNDEFGRRDPGNEVCFFYLNPGDSGRQIVRVDVPAYVAVRPDLVDALHALLLDQCRILGDYPYALARADELAVVGYQDRQNLEGFIANAMLREGIDGAQTAKQSSKSIARAGRSRHTL
ncbi:MAG: DNA double-strand break repair nuclease NurA [Candidatus Promineifilaceae bacterium]